MGRGSSGHFPIPALQSAQNSVPILFAPSLEIFQNQQTLCQNLWNRYLCIHYLLYFSTSLIMCHDIQILMAIFPIIIVTNFLKSNFHTNRMRKFILNQSKIGQSNADYSKSSI